jgi:hypothetical protein
MSTPPLLHRLLACCPEHSKTHGNSLHNHNDYVILLHTSLVLNHLLPAGVCSVAAVVLGQLPGDWGFFGAYLTGGIVLGVLAVGSTAPGLLQV